jgi:MFS family permease
MHQPCEPESSPPQHGVYAPFRLPAFRKYLFASLLTRVGTAGQGLAIGWEMYQRTNLAFALGMVGLVQAIPMFLFTLPGGYLADVFDRRKLMIVSLVGATATSLGLGALSYFQGPIWMMYVLLFLDSTALRLGWPARQAFMPLLVPPKIFESAVKWRSTLGQISAMAGPALGGFVIAWSVPAAYFLAAGSSTFFILVLATLEVPDAPRSPRGDMLEQVFEGILFVWRRRIVLGSISLDLFAVLLGGAVYLLPIYATDILGVGKTGLGYLRAAPAAGALVMGLMLAHMPPMRKAGRTMLWAVAGFGVATIVFGISRNFWLSMAMLFMTGAMDNISVVIRHTLVQMLTPNEMRGRVSAVNAIFIGSSNELGGFESGTVAQLFSPVISVVSGGIGTLLVVATWSRLFPGLRRVGSLSDIHTHATNQQEDASPSDQQQPVA